MIEFDRGGDGKLQVTGQWSFTWQFRYVPPLSLWWRPLACFLWLRRQRERAALERVEQSMRAWARRQGAAAERLATMTTMERYAQSLPFARATQVIEPYGNFPERT